MFTDPIIIAFHTKHKKAQHNCSWQSHRRYDLASIYHRKPTINTHTFLMFYTKLHKFVHLYMLANQPYSWLQDCHLQINHILDFTNVTCKSTIFLTPQLSFRSWIITSRIVCTPTPIVSECTTIVEKMRLFDPSFIGEKRSHSSSCNQYFLCAGRLALEDTCVSVCLLSLGCTVWQALPLLLLTLLPIISSHKSHILVNH